MIAIDEWNNIVETLRQQKLKPKMANLTLHIGAAKTGSTSIQKYLAINRQALLRQGIYIPTLLGHDNHRWLPFLAYNDDRVDDFIKYTCVTDANKRLQLHSRLYLQLRNAVSAHSNLQWIISSEHLSLRLETKEEVSRLRAILSSLFGSVTILYYIRDPIYAAASMWSTMISCDELYPVEFPKPEEVAFLCDYRAVIERWASCFGRNNLHVRLFQAEDFVGGDLLVDFCHAAGIKIQGTRKPARENEVLSAQGMRILFNINKQLPPYIDNTQNQLRGDIASSVQRHFRDFPVHRPTGEEMQQYADFYCDSNRWVINNYFPNKRQLWVKRPLPSSSQRSVKISEELSPSEQALVNLVVDIQAAKTSEISALKEALRANQRSPALAAGLFPDSFIRRAFVRSIKFLLSAPRKLMHSR